MLTRRKPARRLPTAEQCLSLLPYAFAALASRAALSQGLTFAAPAVMAALSLSGANPIGLLISLFAGAVPFGISYQALFVLLSGTLSLDVMLIRQIAANKSPSFYSFLASLTATISAFASSLVLSATDRYSFLSAALCAVISGLLVPILAPGLAIKPYRRVLAADERLALALALALAIAGLGGIPAQIAAALCCLVAATEGAGMGALMGAVTGAALLLDGQGAVVSLILAFGGALGGALRGVGRWAFPAALCLCSLLAPLIGGQAASGLHWTALAAGTALFMWIPAPIAQKAARFVAPPTQSINPTSIAERAHKKAKKQADTLSDAFTALAERYQTEETPLSEQAIIAAMRNMLCEGCSGYRDCWSEGSAARSMLCRIAAQVVSGQGIPDELPPDQLRACKRSTAINRQIRPIVEEFTKLQNERLYRTHWQSAYASLLREASKLAQACAAKAPERRYVLEHEVMATLDRFGLEAREVLVTGTERLEIVITPLSEPIAALLGSLIPAIEETVGHQLRPLRKDGDSLALISQPAFKVTAGTAQIARCGESVSGDTLMVRQLPGGRLMCALSDGMGSGEVASARSQGALFTLEKLIAADVDRALCLRTVNELMLLERDEIFATCDLCLIDLNEGIAEFSKLGSCRSVIQRGKKLRDIPGGKLPMGMLETVEAAESAVLLRRGDRLVMFTDGVADPLRSGHDEWMNHQLANTAKLPPKEAAKQLLRAAVKRDGEKPSDDITLIVADIA